jgi:hypothetical protein
MYFFQQNVSRIGVSVLCLAMVSLAACTRSDSTPRSTASPTVRSTASPTASPTASNSVPATSPANASSSAANTAEGTAEEKFLAILGTQENGWLPKVLAGRGLKQGLSPAEVGKIIPGAEQISDLGFSEVKVQDIPGLKEYQFYYAESNDGEPFQLESIKLRFDPSLNQAYPDLVKVLTDKYGDASPEDIEKELIVWVGPDFVTAQLMKLTDADGYELNISVEEE